MRSHARAFVVVSALLLSMLALGAAIASAVAPTVAIEDASDVSYTTAEVKGSVDPQGQATAYRFQYVSDVQFQENLGNGLPGFEGAATGIESSLEGTGAQPVGGELGALVPKTTYHLRLVAENGDGQSEAVAASTFETLEVGSPSVTLEPVTDVTGNSAKFTGAIDPEAPGGNPVAFDVNWHFECTPACATDNGDTIPADSSSHAVSANALGLEPNTDYEVRLVAKNAGSPKSASAFFKTETPAPIVKTLPAGVITDSSAWIGAKINPQNSPTTYYVEYSSDPGLASSTSIPATQDASAGSGNGLALASYHVGGLQPSTTYYYRVVASGAGATTGETKSLTTMATPWSVGGSLPEGRVYEKISPADKNGGEVRRGGSWAIGPLTNLGQASTSGDAVAYASFGNFAGDNPGTYVQYIARRGAGGWTTEGISPPIEPGPALTNANSYEWLSEDLSLGATYTRAAINPGDGEFNMYERNNLTKSFQTVSKGPLFDPTDEPFLEAVTPDGTYMILSSGGRLLKWSAADEDVQQINFLPDGSAVSAHAGAGGFADLSVETNFLGTNPISVDGSRTYFTTRDVPDANTRLQLFLREGETTISVDKSERSSFDGYTDTAFQAASPDGSTAFFTSSSLLTDESVGGPLSGRLYRWERDAAEGQRLTDLTTADPSGPGVLGTAGASQAVDAVYFAASGVLAPGAEQGQPNLYLWREGEGISLVATLSDGDGAVWATSLFGNYGGGDPVYRDARVSPDGRYIAFTSYASLTSYDTNGTKQVYLFDSQQERLTCVSCGTVEAKSTANSMLQSIVYDDTCCDAGRFHLSRNLTPDGTRLFFDSNDALVPGDTNGVTDVYEWTGGQIHLISGGISAVPSRLFDVGENGDNVFFTTLQKLVPSDGDAYVDLYDARVGGLSEPVVRAPCIGDECQGTPTAPPTPEAPSSSSALSSGNVTAKPRARCSKKKVRRAGRCIAKRKKKSNTVKKGRNHR